MIDGELIAGFDADSSCARVNCDGCAVVPGFIDCHTHLPFAGWRAQEYALKVAGTPYAEIARQGGGIRSSAAALETTSDDAVLDAVTRASRGDAAPRNDDLRVQERLRALGRRRAARAATGRSALDEVPQSGTVTALLAHAVPDGYTLGELDG